MLKEVKLLEALSLSEKECISIIGGGGKTSLANYISGELFSLGKNVVSTTTTRVFPPHTGEKQLLLFTTESLWIKNIEKAFNSNKLVYLGSEIMSNGKLKGISVKDSNTLYNKTNVNYLIIEADGSKGKSIKAHLAFEPVVPDITGIFISVIGIDCFMKKVDCLNCHRPEQISSITGFSHGASIDINLILELFKHPDGYLKTLPHEARSYVFINKVTKNELHIATELAENLLSLKRIDGVFIGNLIGKENFHFYGR